jgi:hypothetical protein
MATVVFITVEAIAARKPLTSAEAIRAAQLCPVAHYLQQADDQGQASAPRW